jgi:hypothetical protein
MATLNIILSLTPPTPVDLATQSCRSCGQILEFLQLHFEVQFLCVKAEQPQPCSMTAMFKSKDLVSPRNTMKTQLFRVSFESLHRAARIICSGG